MELSVIVPCLNEEANVPELVSRVGEVFVGRRHRRRAHRSSTTAPATGPGRRSRRPIARTRSSSDGATRRTAASPRGLENRRGGGARAAGLHPRRRSAVSARGHIALRREMEVSNVDIVQGWRSPVGRDKGPRYLLFARAQHDAQRARSAWPQDNKSRLHAVRARDPRRSAFVSRHLLSTGSRSSWWRRTPRATPTSRSRRCSSPPCRQSFLDNAPMKAVARSFIDIGRRWSSIDFAHNRRRPCGRSSIAIRRSCVRAGADLAARLLGRLSALFGATHWMMTKEAGTQLADLRESQWLSPEKMRELQSASSANGAPRLQARTVLSRSLARARRRARRHSLARRSRSVCRS